MTGVLCSTHYMTWSFVLGFWHTECERLSVLHSGSHCTVSWSELGKQLSLEQGLHCNCHEKPAFVSQD